MCACDDKASNEIIEQKKRNIEPKTLLKTDDSMAKLMLGVTVRPQEPEHEFSRVETPQPSPHALA